MSNFLTIGGTSAGTTILESAPMVTGGESYDALRYGANDYSDSNYPDDLSYLKEGGFGFFNYSCYLDSHFGSRGRQGRMIALLYDLF